MPKFGKDDVQISQNLPALPKLAGLVIGDPRVSSPCQGASPRKYERKFVSEFD